MPQIDTCTSSSGRLKWLHLSDFHLRVSTGWSQDTVLSTMLADIRNRYKEDGRPDLVFLTGDIAFSGKEEEYLYADSFIRELCSAIDISSDRICIVPGNHDIDISLEEDAVAGARHRLKTPIEVDHFLGNEGRRRTLFARQHAFRTFVNRVHASRDPVYSPSSYSHAQTFQVGALRVRVLLLDSSWLANGGHLDAGQLLVGERQILDCGEPDDECLTFALLHHPFSWLREYEQISIENLVARHAHICLRGHVHTPDLRTTDGPQGLLTTFTAGATFQNRTADNTYIWCSLDLTTGQGEKIIHRYNHAEYRWVASARETWKFLQGTQGTSDLAAIQKSLLTARVRYASYVTCLLGKLQTEVPILIPNRPVTFVACDAQTPSLTNRCGDLVVRLRNHFHWKQVWDTTAWSEQLNIFAVELNSHFSEVEAIESHALHSRDENSATLLLTFADPSGVSSTACDEIRYLLADNELDRARAVLERWLGLEILRPDEARELSRLEVFLFLAEQNINEANDRAIALITSSDRTPEDIALAATCAFHSMDHKRAASLMSEALDLGLPSEGVKSIARAIAGAAGDQQLARRVL